MEPEVLVEHEDGIAIITIVAEFLTAAQENANLCIIVMNDGIYAAIGHIQDTFQDGRRFFGELRGPDIGGLARLAGMRFWRVTRADEFGPSVAEAIAVEAPTIVEVDMRTIGPVPAYGAYRRRACRSS